MAGGRRPHPEALYYHIAHDALKAAQTESDKFRKAEFVTTCMVFSALCLEAYINQEYHNFPEAQKIIRANDRMSIETKWLLLPLIMGAPITFEEGSFPYQTFQELVRTRNNRLVHFKPWREIDLTENSNKRIYLGDLVCDLSLAEKYWKCISEMIKKLHALTAGRTDLPNFLKGSKYTSEVWATLEIERKIEGK